MARASTPAATAAYGGCDAESKSAGSAQRSLPSALPAWCPPNPLAAAFAWRTAPRTYPLAAYAVRPSRPFFTLAPSTIPLKVSPWLLHTPSPPPGVTGSRVVRGVGTRGLWAPGGGRGVGCFGGGLPSPRCHPLPLTQPPSNPAPFATLFASFRTLHRQPRSTPCPWALNKQAQGCCCPAAHIFLSRRAPNNRSDPFPGRPPLHAGSCHAGGVPPRAALVSFHLQITQVRAMDAST
mgnify:CR=1 FL=1